MPPIGGEFIGGKLIGGELIGVVVVVPVEFAVEPIVVVDEKLIDIPPAPPVMPAPMCIIGIQKEPPGPEDTCAKPSFWKLRTVGVRPGSRPGNATAVPVRRGVPGEKGMEDGLSLAVDAEIATGIIAAAIPRFAWAVWLWP
jgi:hypothetical protein